MYCVFPCVKMELLRNTVVFTEVLLKPFPTSTRRWARTEKATQHNAISRNKFLIAILLITLQK